MKKSRFSEEQITMALGQTRKNLRTLSQLEKKCDSQFRAVFDAIG
jgi:hypothetical protein